MPAYQHCVVDSSCGYIEFSLRAFFRPHTYTSLLYVLNYSSLVFQSFLLQHMNFTSHQRLFGRNKQKKSDFSK